MDAPSSKICAINVLETVPSIMQFVRVEMRRHRGLGLSVPQFRVLTFLERQPGSSVSDAAERVGLSLPAMSRLIDGLMGRGLLTRVDSSSDRRRVSLTLTDAGRDLVRMARQGARDGLGVILENLSGRDRATVVGAMEILRPLFVHDQPGVLTPVR